MKRILLVGLGCLWCPLLGAQDGPDATPPSLSQQEIDKLRKDFQLELDDLQFQIDTLEQEAAKARQAGNTAQRLNVFNPQITVFGNFLGRTDDQPVYVDEDPTAARIDDTLHLREFEVDLRAAIDPWADGVLILSMESEAPGEFSTGVEEGYLTLKKLPLLDAAPAGMKVKIGRFRAEFGRFNKIHLHDLPQLDYPRSLGRFLGPEGYAQDGVSTRFFLPTPGDASTLEATVQVLSGGGLPMGEGELAGNLAGLGHLAWFQELSDANTLEAGLSAWTEEAGRQLYGADLTWKWRPPATAGYRSFLLGGEWFQGRLDTAGIDEDPMGWFVWSQYQLGQNTYVGARFDHSEELTDPGMVTHTTGAYLTWYTTEFLRFRLGVEHADSDLALLDRRNSGFLEINLVFGSHPVEPYWVNR